MTESPNSQLAFHDGSCCHCGGTQDLFRFTEFGKAVCPRCYPDFFRRRVASALRRYEMTRKGETIGVALSGGKDSAALLHALWLLRRRLNLQIVAIHINMGLHEFSERSEQTVREMTGQLGVPLLLERVADYALAIQPAGNFAICSVCGAIRRSLLDRVGLRENLAAVATGHTLDDRLQQMLKRLLTGRLDAPKPVLSGDEFHPRKIKPLSLIPDRASLAYVECVGLPFVQTCCAGFQADTHRFKQVFDLLEELAPMAKSQLANTLQKTMKAPPPGGPDHPCPRCGEPTGTDLCPLCRLRQVMQDTAGRSASP